jgi:hypothetical protein
MKPSLPSFPKFPKRDQLAAIEVVVDDNDLVQTTVDGLPESWETFLSSINGREVQPNFERLWHDCLEEEGRIKSRNEPSTVKDLALSAKSGKWKRFPQHKRKGKKLQGKHYHPHSHLFKVRCFNYNKIGNYAKDCRNPPSKQKRKVSSLRQLSLRKKSLGEREPKLPLKNKSNAKRFILFQLSPVLSPN